MEEYLKSQKNKYNNTKISTEADKKIKVTLENLPERKKTKRFNIVAAAIVFVCISALLSTNVSQVKADSIIKSILGYFVKDNNLNDNYGKYANAVNKTTTNNGVEITIDSIASDSLGVTLGYSLKTDKAIKGADLGVTKLLINGKETSFENTTNYYKEIGNLQYVGYESFKVKDLPKNFKFEIVVNSVGDISGQWSFKLNASNEDINENTFVSNTSFQKVSEDGILNISKIISTPLNTYIQLTYKSNNPIKSEDKIPYSTVFLMDENNRMVTIEDVKSTIVDEYTYKTEFYIKEYKGKLNKLTIIPYKAPEISKEPRRLEDDNEFYNLKTKTPFVINAGDMGEIKVNSMVETRDKVTMNCSIESIYGDLLVNALGLGYDIKLNADPAINNFNPIGFNKNTMDKIKTLTNLNNVVLEFDKDSTLKDDKYVLVFQKYIKEIKVYPELKITVPID
ncbi:DUF4179 domain-containing protein [Clostridium folliculivorans]|uniref:DUF4179 domain-containing protein n=1 Tax=Clostridium folliculivorans TaxID=2886038 RepID=A0A9W6DBM7_9CLOT|nr:DUF4179 domain-containing protein [Clostridium folliculivorans]GKU26595.1 hypothetical protein CFOLD11_34220 [Clostridium folliculivorans]GKU28973.1 hypothetical protein CFB3_10790 [Clostridium folliculivorans]